ncbi:hypothetical protein [Altericista sp. CCNU0014]|uniref:hypothetical protein n=1 Tax=Altericista sp. CCNU0014 TaxID=3082949 RepID=UPI00384F95AB
MAIAKYIQETTTANPVSSFIDTVVERITHRRERTRRMLVRRRIIHETQDLQGIVVRGELVFIERPQVIRILDTNGKGINFAARREQDNCELQGREQMKPGVHFEDVDNVQYWSQRGIVRLAQNMSENLGNKSASKSRKTWTDAVAEVVEDAIEYQKKYIESFDARITRAMNHVKSQADKKCQVTHEKQEPAAPFDLHVHHLFDRATRPDLADFQDNLIAIHENLHRNFHDWHGSASCEPKHFIDYLTTVESWRFEKPRMTTHLQRLINRLEKLQLNHENHRRL